MTLVRYIFTLIGCAAVFVGMMALALTTPPLVVVNPHPEITPDVAIYIGTGSCLSCHDDADWTDLKPRTIVNEVINPRAVAVTTSFREMQETDSEITENRQQYIVRAENGYLVLPGHWQIGDQVFFFSKPDSRTEVQCSACHNMEDKQ